MNHKFYYFISVPSLQNDPSFLQSSSVQDCWDSMIEPCSQNHLAVHILMMCNSKGKRKLQNSTTKVQCVEKLGITFHMPVIFPCFMVCLPIKYTTFSPLRTICQFQGWHQWLASVTHYIFRLGFFQVQKKIFVKLDFYTYKTVTTGYDIFFLLSTVISNKFDLSNLIKWSLLGMQCWHHNIPQASHIDFNQFVDQNIVWKNWVHICPKFNFLIGQGKPQSCKLVL